MTREYSPRIAQRFRNFGHTHRLVAGIAGLSIAAGSAAQSAATATAPYPTKPIRAIVGFVPGGATDIMARTLGQKLTEALGQQIIVDNHAGGGGIIAATMAKESPPDGYTIFFGTISTLATKCTTRKYGL